MFGPSKTSCPQMVAVVSLACLTTLAPLPSEQLDIHKSQLVVLAMTSIPRQLLSTLYIIHTFHHRKGTIIGRAWLEKNIAQG